MLCLLLIQILTSQPPEELSRDAPAVPAASTPVAEQISTSLETKVDENNLPSAASEIPIKNTVQADATAAAQETPAQQPSSAGTQQVANVNLH